MRPMTRTITAIVLVSAAARLASGQQVTGEYIVDSRIVSDVAVNQSGIATNPTPDMSANAEPTVDGGPSDSYPVYVDDGVVYEATPSAAGGQARQRLYYLAHGGEVGPTVGKQYAQPDLFYNYYSNGRNQVNAEMYLSPVPVPPFVGNTWVTYQPLMPHNYLYKHTDRYHNHYDYGRGTNRTKIKYSVSARQYAETIFNTIRLPH